MKTTLLTAGLALFLLGLVAYQQENGDIAAASMYFVVYTIPTIMLVILNNLFLLLLPSTRKQGIKSMLMSLTPSLFLIGIGSLFTIKTGYLDGSVSFLFILTGIATAITSLYWRYRQR